MLKTLHFNIESPLLSEILKILILHNLCSVKHRFKKKTCTTHPSIILENHRRVKYISYYQVISNSFMNFTGQGSSGKNKLLQGHQLKVRQFYWESEHINIFERRQGKSEISWRHSFRLGSLNDERWWHLPICDVHVHTYIAFITDFWPAHRFLRFLRFL